MHLLADLVDRGLDVEQGVLVVLDGSKALRAAVAEVFGPVAGAALHPSQGAQRARPPARARPPSRQDAAAQGVGQRRPRARARRPPSARGRARALPIPAPPARCREGLPETLTLTRLGIHGRLKRTLQSTNPIESMIETVRRTSRNVKRWQSGDMCLRWTAAGMLEAEQQFRKVIGYSDLAKLADRRRARPRRPARRRSPPQPARRPLRSPPSDHHIGTAVTKFHDGRDNLVRGLWASAAAA